MRTSCGKYGKKYMLGSISIGNKKRTMNCTKRALGTLGLKHFEPKSALTMDAAGNLYGTTEKGRAHLQGNVFKLTRNGNSWMYTDLHDFPSQPNDGVQPWGGVTLDSSGHLYGTTGAGGT